MLRFNEDIEKEIVNVIKEYEFASKADDYLNYDFEGEKVIFSLLQKVKCYLWMLYKKLGKLLADVLNISLL